MKTVFFNILMIIAFNANGQNKTGIDQFTGLYFGGQSYGETMNGIGYYYFKPDSSFIFLRTGFSNIKTKEFNKQFNDTLTGYGKGHWYVKNNAIVVRFESIQDENIQNGKLKYSGYSKAPFDSLFLNITVANHDNNNFGVASIIFPEKNIGAATDSLGFSKAALLKSNNLDNILVSKPGYSDMQITLPKNFNVHELSIMLAKSDGSNIELVSKADFAFKFHYENKILVFDGKLKRQNNGKEKLILLIQNAITKFPRQITFLRQIMSEIN